MGADGIAFLHTGTGKLFTSNPVGARIWRRLGEGASLETIAADLSREFAIEIRDAQADARNFVYTLLEKRLVFRSGVRS